MPSERLDALLRNVDPFASFIWTPGGYLMTGAACRKEMPSRPLAGPAPRSGMLVDGNPEVLALSAASLRAAGYSVIASRSMRQALRDLFLSPGAIDFVITDYEPDGARARTLASAVHVRFPHARILATANRGLAAADHGGCFDDVLIKPFTPPELVQRVGKLLGADLRAGGFTPASDANAVHVLAVGNHTADLHSLERIFAAQGWVLRRADTVREAVDQHLSTPARVMMVESETLHGGWRALMDQFGWAPYGPRLIVSSRQADERLWAEVLNLGAFDVVSVPFEEREIRHVVSHAWDSWHDEWAPPRRGVGRAGAAT
jgi:DNA-binding NtrC family response regulator